MTYSGWDDDKQCNELVLLRVYLVLIALLLWQKPKYCMCGIDEIMLHNTSLFLSGLFGNE